MKPNIFASFLGIKKIFVYSENQVFSGKKPLKYVKIFNNIKEVNNKILKKNEYKLVEYTVETEKFYFENFKDIDMDTILIFNDTSNINIEKILGINIQKAIFAPITVKNLIMEEDVFEIKELVEYNFKKEELLVEFAGIESLLKKVTDVNQKHFPGTFQNIKSSVKNKKYEDAARHAHTLRGSLGIFFDENTSFWNLLKELELHCKEENVDEITLLKLIKEIEIILLGFDYYFKNHKWNIEE